MCGICGYLRLRNGAAVDPAVVYAMCRVMSHRGPDDEGVYIDANAGLGMRRLAVIDLRTGAQPMHNEDRTVWIVYNGETYNFQDLRRELEARGHRFRSRSDTEVILHGYEEWGEEVVRRLRGMFAFAIWDARRRRLLLARDRLGIKPLHIGVTDDFLVFGSEIKCLLCFPGIERRLDPAALSAYLTFNHVPAPMTIYRGIRKVLPGHLLVCDRDGVRDRAYWDVTFEPDPKISMAEAEERLLQLLEEAVRLRLVSDVPLGVLLSGGVDSSAVTALATRALGRPVKTFSVGFEEQSFNELEAARTVARLYETEHHEDILRPDAVGLLHDLVRYFDEPFADSSALPTFLVSKMARRDVTVALTGDGGDEVFAGYLTYAGDWAAEHYRRLPAVLRRGVIEPLVRRLPVSDAKQSLDYMAKRFVAGAHLPPLERHHSWRVICTEEVKRRLCPDLLTAGDDPIALLRAHYERRDGADASGIPFGCQRHPERDFISRLQYVDLKTSLPDDMLVKVDRMSMANSLEARVPLLDHHLVEFAATLPSRFKLRGLRKKVILKRALRGLLPPEILRRKKHGFSVPMAAWLRGELREVAGDLLSGAEVGAAGLFDPAAVNALLEEHLAGRCDWSRNLWGLLVFAVWHREYMRSDFPSAGVALRAIPRRHLAPAAERSQPWIRPA
jgi:asparagine synthase (glutamine-hydrolysing)